MQNSLVALGEVVASGECTCTLQARFGSFRYNVLKSRTWQDEAELKSEGDEGGRKGGARTQWTAAGVT